MKVCTEPGCPVLVRGGRCATHGQRSTQADAASRGYDHEWRKVRAPYLAAHPTCVDCGAVATIADHLDGLGPLGPRGADWSNLEAVCKRCHNRRTLRFDGGWGNPRRPRPATTSRCALHPQCISGSDVGPARPMRGVG